MNRLDLIAEILLRSLRLLEEEDAKSEKQPRVPISTPAPTTLGSAQPTKRRQRRTPEGGEGRRAPRRRQGRSDR
jgi:hypothetical protein